jgi:hypothetical protein
MIKVKACDRRLRRRLRLQTSRKSAPAAGALQRARLDHVGFSTTIANNERPALTRKPGLQAPARFHRQRRGPSR